MHPFHLYAPHLDRAKLKTPPQSLPPGSVCAFTGEQLTEGYAVSKLLSGNFTDQAYLRFPSKCAGVPAALCLSDVVPSKSRPDYLVGIKLASSLVTATRLRWLDRADWLDVLLAPPAEPFVLCLTYANKKHMSYKARVNYDPRAYVVQTDTRAVPVDLDTVERFLPILRQWYGLVPDKADTAAAPTWFTKEELKTGILDPRKISAYGMAQAEAENGFLRTFRGQPQFALLVDALTKQAPYTPNAHRS